MPPTDIRRFGIWGKPTSTLDWCEDNYVISDYIAEFWNTVSNWILIIPPFLGVWLSMRENMELLISFMFLVLAVVGVGSFLFHCTLLYKMQLLDELPMIYGSCILLYVCICCRSREHQIDWKWGSILSSLCFSVTVVYLTVPDPLVFQWCYGLIVAALSIVVFHCCRKRNGSRQLAALGVLSYSIGFILWNVDNNLCHQLKAFRSAYPRVATFSQCHAWWHLLAGAGTYMILLFCTHLRLNCLGYTTKIQVYWKCLPFIKREKAKTSVFLNNNAYLN